jgi:hypothetical protein
MIFAIELTDHIDGKEFLSCHYVKAASLEEAKKAGRNLATHNWDWDDEDEPHELDKYNGIWNEQGDVYTALTSVAPAVISILDVETNKLILVDLNA